MKVSLPLIEGLMEQTMAQAFKAWLRGEQTDEMRHKANGQRELVQVLRNMVETAGK